MRALSLVLALLLPAPVLAEAALVLDQPVTWPRATLPAFGCLLERELGERDPTFNCDLRDYVNAGDPCEATDAYYEGFAAPAALAARLGVQEVQLTWEHGDLQSVFLVLPERQSEAAWRARFALPDPLPENVENLSFQDCIGDQCRILGLFGFDHLGAGDVDCAAD